MRLCDCGNRVECGDCPYCGRWNDAVVLASQPFVLDVEVARMILNYKVKRGTESGDDGKDN